MGRLMLLVLCIGGEGTSHVDLPHEVISPVAAALSLTVLPCQPLLQASHVWGPGEFYVLQARMSLFLTRTCLLPRQSRRCPVSEPRRSEHLDTGLHGASSLEFAVHGRHDRSLVVTCGGAMQV